MKKLSINVSTLDFTRVSIIGCPGSGKTTFSKQLGELLNRPVTHLDKVLWGANWQMLPFDERQVIHNGLISQENWIIDGMWKSHLPDRLDKTTLVVFLDYKRSVSMGRAIKRRVKYGGKQRDDIADGCLEKLDNYFLHYIWTFRKQVRPYILNELSKRPCLTVVTLQTPKQTKQFLQTLNNY
ncbi:MAG: AAA family ATPase, partial [Clostridia bacterium]|nr:AAA family ATPase [Clostridia bacterium]